MEFALDWEDQLTSSSPQDHSRLVNMAKLQGVEPWHPGLRKNPVARPLRGIPLPSSSPSPLLCPLPSLPPGWPYPNRLCDLELMFGCHSSTLSIVSNQVHRHIAHAFGHLLRDLTAHSGLNPDRSMASDYEVQMHSDSIARGSLGGVVALEMLNVVAMVSEIHGGETALKRASVGGALRHTQSRGPPKSLPRSGRRTSGPQLPNRSSSSFPHSLECETVNTLHQDIGE
ncbi:hypothetical protein HPB47_026631, partial [Ixodes persulcatus]